MILSLEVGINSSIGDAACILATNEAEIALLTPTGSPRILYDPVVLVVRTITDLQEDDLIRLLVQCHVINVP